MRNKLLFALAGMAVMAAMTTMFTGCSQEVNSDLPASKTTRFNVSVEGGVNTRAAVTDLTRYVMEVYQGATATGTPLMHQEQATGTFTDVVLDNAQQYTVLFWADYGTPTTQGGQPSAANEYNAADLKAAFIAQQPTKAAYAGLSRFTVGTDNEAIYTAVTLKHAVAQVSFKQTETLTAATNTLVVSYPKSFSLNVDGNAVTEIAGTVTHRFAYNSKAIGTIGTSYLIAATGTPKTMFDITATLNNETAIDISNVPFERNFRTNISGAFSNLYDATLSVTCDDAWEATENEAEIPSDASDYIEVNGVKVATGNLVANGANGAKIGLPTDGGLFFQFGSLVGWNATGDPTVAVSPVGYTGSTTWNENWAGNPATENVATGTGDPCKYYLKGTWRLPTKDEYAALFNNVTDESYANSGGWSWNVNSVTNSTKNLTLPAAGYRSTDDGGLRGIGGYGYYWSSSPNNAKGYYLYFRSSGVNLSSSTNQTFGMSVRCVRN